MQAPAIRRLALAAIDGRRVLAIEAEKPVSPEAIRSSLSWAQLDQVVFPDRVPVDKRRNAKIDYVVLVRKLEVSAIVARLLS